jgi:hypothetical protein
MAEKLPGKTGAVPPPEALRMSIDTVREMKRDLLLEATEQLELIGPSLRDLASRIQEQKPRAVIFMDKSARPFGTPFKSFLQESMGKDAPAVLFYNDAWLKQAYLDNDPVFLKKVAEEDLETVAGKKVFFVDETFSRGRGAAAIKSASAFLGSEVHYFALSRDPDTTVPLHLGEYALSEEQHAKNIQEIEHDSRFVIYPNPIHNLFSRFVSRMYVDEDSGGSTYGVWGGSNEAPGERVATLKELVLPLEEVDQEQFSKEVRTEFFDCVRSVKQMIYKTLTDRN